MRPGRSAPPGGEGPGGAEGGKAPLSRGKEPLPAGKEPPCARRAMEDVLPSGLLEICLLVGAPTERVRALLQVSGVGAGGASAWGWDIPTESCFDRRTSAKLGEFGGGVR